MKWTALVSCNSQTVWPNVWYLEMILGTPGLEGTMSLVFALSIKPKRSALAPQDLLRWHLQKNALAFDIPPVR